MTKKRQEAVQTERTLVEQTAIEQPKANVKYKDTIFRMLFSEPEHLLSLYNAVTGKDYRDPDALNVVTLENAVYMGMKNDLAFVLEMGMYLYEHQSTYNPNIPLRDLFYIASEYQALADGKSLYSSGIQKIPTPKFLVFYNGLDHKVPDRMELRLSDAYENPVDEPELELKVTMLNINAGHNEELMNNCHVLWEYAEYVARVRRIFDDHKVCFQTAELGKVDVGGGGTIAFIAALYGMEVIDSGVSVLSMHAPWEVTSKADVYEAKKAYKAFLLDA